ncbi:hypothetical protein BDV32DRAFT_139246 [Aspergillus pseudonomiae]|uniref:Uncharacterized protein n=1 Tax=Aspergillus pseudonomiae TaxID=1506151 RepID=A0A5N7DPI5_9EURO|nr:uncharacterized protein BDV37DRAFT_268708 [Aspergillus pseudonomiae]KAB8259002.1 hypothetical protein BDV32DRAFT_139246 [Aspergillus pseudonomiae]KAE8407929.1 hypothetical protein BDV37DRAFT_268708 [Aspergillus pseudonomiae]
MSPTPHLPNVNSNPNSVESSNSTANIFLGGVRRSWMLNAANCPSSFSCHSKIPDDSAAATSSNNAVAVSAAADAAAAAGRTRQQGMRESSSLRVLPVPSPSQENAASITTAVAAPSQSPSQPNVISPVTTGHAQQQFQQHSPVSRGTPWHIVSDRAGPDPPLAVTAATTTQSVPIASFPNPIEVPSPICDSSSTVVNRNGASPSVTAFPSPRTVGPAPLPHQPQAGTAVSTSSPAGVGARNPSWAGRQRERSNTSLQPQRQGSHASHSHSPVLSPAFPSSAASPRLQMVQPPNASRRNPSHDPILDDAFYEQSLKTLENFQEQLKQRDCLGNVEQPRTQLLYQACAERDPLFLAIHQVYCLHSLAPQEFLQLPGYTVLQECGLDVIRRLLVENNRVSAGFLRWSTQFPAPLVGLMQRSRYRQVVEQAGQCLRLLAERWPMYVKDVRKREFPPLVDELVKNFEITSGALAYTIFLSTCRTLPGSRSEEHLKAVWELDLRYYQQRCASPRPVSNAQLYEEHQKVIQAYRSVSVPTGTHQPGPHPTLSHGSTSVGRQRSFRFYSSGNRVYRLRCIKMPSVANEVAESMWSVAESVWPSVFYVHVNGVELFVRRRVHNGKDLPLDITDHLIEGDNMISLHFIRSPAEANDMLYAMAVEVLEISDLVRAFSLAQALSPSECREQICQRVSSSLQDDEVSVVSDHLSINLVDPFTARIFSRPVRGRSCKHQDCFDHLTWIQTRASTSGKRSLKNDWKCPICGQDARPQQLVIDGYLQEVRAELARINLLEGAKAILIKADGSWELKSESDARPSECGPDNTGERVPSKRKASETSNYSPAPAAQRPKSERTNSAKGPVCNTHPPQVIALD